MTIDIEALEAAAKAATPGPWVRGPFGGIYPAPPEGSDKRVGGPGIGSCRNSNNVPTRYAEENERFMAAANPKVVLGLLRRLRTALGHNPVITITPRLAYRYMDALAKAKGMQVANTDLKVLNQVLNHGVRWGVLERNALKGTVRYYGKRDGLTKERTRYVEDWELAAWQTVASRQQRAFPGGQRRVQTDCG